MVCNLSSLLVGMDNEFSTVLLWLLQSACQEAAAFCKGKGKNISKLALQYSLSNTAISSVLVGMNSVRQVSHLKQLDLQIVLH